MAIKCSKCGKDLFKEVGRCNVGGALMNVYECCECGEGVFLQYGVGEYGLKLIENKKGENVEWKKMLENKSQPILKLLG
jgi:hypothetical protein